jgi:hypothetical protein
MKQDGEPQRSVTERAEAKRGQIERYQASRRKPRGKKEANFMDSSDHKDSIYIVLQPDDDVAQGTSEPTTAAVAITNSSSIPAVSTNGTVYSVSLHSKGFEHSTEADWYVDSGASFHYCRHRDWFDTFEPLTGKTVTLGDGREVALTGRGTLNVSVPISRTEYIPGTFTNVQYVPDLKVNLLSVSALTNHDITVTFLKHDCVLRANDGKGRIMGRAERISNKLYKLTVKARTTSKSPSTAFPAAVNLSSPASATKQSAADAALELWHKRFGHVHHAAVHHLLTKGMVSDADRLGLPPSMSLTTANLHCDACRIGKSARQPFPSSETQSTAPLELVHTDVFGPVRIPSPGGARYFMTIIDDFSNRVWLRFMKTRDEVLHHFTTYKAWVETQLSHRGLRIK